MRILRINLISLTSHDLNSANLHLCYAFYPKTSVGDMLICFFTVVQADENTLYP